MKKINLREKRREKLRRSILNTAEALIRDRGNTNFPMRLLSDQAEVSLATPYNILGSKEDILLELLFNIVKETEFRGLNLRQKDPFEFLVSASKSAFDSVTTDKKLLRPLVKNLFSSEDSEGTRKVKRESLVYWTITAQKGILKEKVSLEQPSRQALAIGYSLYSHAFGLLLNWIHENLSDESLRMSSLHGTLLIGLGYVTGQAEREKFITLIESTRERMDQLSSGSFMINEISNP